MDIIGYENYKIYPDGRVWSKGFDKYHPPRFINGNISGDNYKDITLYKNNISKGFRLHRLIALHYISNPNNYDIVDHKNRNTLDNRLENLRWVNRETNNRNSKLKLCKYNSGHKYVNWDKSRNKWFYQNSDNKKRKRFNNKIDALCYKYIQQLRLKVLGFHAN